jgi:inorganic pyrophosphatase
MTARARKLSELEPRDGEGDAVTIVIETSRGARTKLAYDAKREAFVVKKILPQGMSFPFDFGFIPSTLGGDGDPLDVLVLMDEPVPAGAIVPSRIVGVIEAVQTEKDGTSEENDRLVAVAEASQLFADVKKLSDLPPALAKQIEHFFISYNEQDGKRFEPRGTHGPKKALELVDAGKHKFKRRKRDRKHH